jgi:DNA primase
LQVQGKFLDTLRSRLSLAEIVGAKVKLTRKGRTFTGLCPFHHEKTPSFTVNEERESYHCFGCGAHGDIISFLMEVHNHTFMEAVKELANRAGLSLPDEPRGKEEEKKEDLTLLRQVMNEAMGWFHKNLHHLNGTEALRYTDRRGITRETLKKFTLGYALNERHGLETYLKKKGFTEDTLITAGLLVTGEDIKVPFDKFRKRLMFPIFDTRGQVVAFGGRLLEKGEPKYLNSPETPLFSKGKLLYGYSHARDKEKTDPLSIVEGYMDVISLQQAGHKGAVAPLGTALTEDQIQLAWRLSPEPILCFDGDAAGMKAAMRAAERVLPLLKPGYSMQFVFLPQGEDPDTLIKKGNFFESLLNKPHSLVDTLWMFLTRGKSFKTPEQKAALQKQCTIWSQAIQNTDIKKNYHYAFKDFFYKNVVNRKDSIKPVSSLKMSNVNLFLIHERLLLAILINHPNLIDETSDDFASLEFKEARLNCLKDAILSFYGKGYSDEMSMNDYLNREGFENEVEEILSPQILIHGSFAKTTATFEEAREGWREIFNRLQNALSKDDLKQAQDHLAKEMSENAWQRLKMLKKNALAQD